VVDRLGLDSIKNGFLLRTLTGSSQSMESACLKGSLDSMERGTVDSGMVERWNGIVERWNGGMVDYD
jgi:hypothetical protein